MLLSGPESLNHCGTNLELVIRTFYLREVDNICRKTREIPLVHLFPPSSTLFSSLFIRMNDCACSDPYPSRLPTAPSSSSLTSVNHVEEPQYSPDMGPSPYDVLPSNELLIEALGNVWLRMYSGGVYSKGVLLLSTHRVIFIHYPTDRDAGFTVMVPLSRIPTVSIRRRWKDKYNTMALLCRDQIAYLFVCLRDESEVRTLEAFRRIKSEIKWRREEDNFCSSLDQLVISEHFVKLKEDERTQLHTAAETGDESAAKRMGSGPVISPSSSANDFSSANLVSRGVSKEVAVATVAVRMEQNSGTESTPKDSKVAQISEPFDMCTEFDRYASFSLVSLVVLIVCVFVRMGINDVPQWRFSTANKDFKLCSTYPRDLVVPTVISDRHLRDAAGQRSSRRLPVLTWLHPNGAALCRYNKHLLKIL